MQETGVLSAERLSGMKAAIHAFLSEASVYESVRDIVDAYIAEHADDSSGSSALDDSQAVLRLCKERGVLQQLLARLQRDGTLGTRATTAACAEAASNTALPALPSSSSCYCLHVRVTRGRAFVDHVDVTPSAAQRMRLCVALHFGDQRVRGALRAVAVEPRFDDDFVLQVDAGAYGFAPHELLEVAAPLHVAVLREHTRDAVAELVGENVVDWRKVLRTGRLDLTVELCDTSNGTSVAGVPAGIVDMHLTLLPPSSRSAQDTASVAPWQRTAVDIDARLAQQRAAVTAADRDFLVYARRWWAEYMALRPSHKQRKVRLFAATASGRMLPVTHFVSALQARSGLDSPLDAARFVALIKATNGDGSDTSEALADATPLLRAGDGGGGSGAAWLTRFVFLSQRQGAACNHATLLCSLLLGFGLDAYCVVGRDARSSGSSSATCMYVLTRTRGSGGVLSVTLWEPTTGVRTSPSGAHTLATADCAFNHRTFYANAQLSSSTLTTSFDFDNDEFWRVVSPLKLRMVPRYANAPLLCDVRHYSSAGGDDGAGSGERSLEAALRARVAHYRDGVGLLTQYDDQLAYTLAQALYAYEQQRVNGAVVVEAMTLFEQCVKGVLGPGKTFRATPVNVRQPDDAVLFAVLQGSAAGKEVLDSVGDDAHFALRVRVFAFPEGVCSVWAMLAVAYSATAVASPTTVAAASPIE